MTMAKRTSVASGSRLSGRGVWVRLWWMVLLLLASGAMAQAPGPGAALQASPGHEPGRVASRRAMQNQAWFVLLSREAGLVGGQPAQVRVPLAHLAPRSGPMGARDGAVRLAGTLVQFPVAWCTRGSRLFLMFEEVKPPAPLVSPVKPRRVLSYAAVRGETGEWATEPQGRPEALPSFEGTGDLLDMVGSDAGVFVLRRMEDGTLRLDRLDPEAPKGQSQWAQVQGLPPAMQVSQERLLLAGYAQGVLVASPREAGTIWAVNCLGPTPTWASRGLGQVGGAGGARRALVVCAGQLLLAWEDRGTLRVAARAMEASGLPALDSAWREVFSKPDLGEDWWPMAMDADERLAFLYLKPHPGKPEEKLTYDERLIEISARTGRVFYDGPVRIESPISNADYVLLGVVAWLVVGMVLAGVVPAREGAVVIPEGASISEPTRRIIAGLIDFSLAILAVTRIQGVALADVTALGWWSSVSGQVIVIEALGSLIVVCTVFESLLGRTPGKLVAGCEVVSSAVKLVPGEQLGEARPTLWRSLVRNVCKWGLPPLGLLGVMDPSGRGRPDQYSRTAVIVRYIPEDEPLDEDRDE